MFYKDSELRKRNKNFDLDNMEKKYIEREMFKQKQIEKRRQMEGRQQHADDDDGQGSFIEQESILGS